MNEVLLAVLIVAGIGLIVGVGLSVASALLAVKKDEKEEAIRACLPGANCGACGFSGCDGYAAALAKGEAESVSLCAPGGQAVAEELGALLGKEAESMTPVAAVVRCGGDCHLAKEKLRYAGIESCKAASQLFGGHKACQYGCLGYGDCVKACPYQAIFLCNGVARVNPAECRACRKCVSVCPKGVITMLPTDRLQAVVLCRNTDKGAETHKQCNAGCIGCGKCMRTCENGAITVENFLARVDADKCTGCGKCKDACPIHCIEMVGKA